MMNARRHARDYERLVQHSETPITWAAITLMTRRIRRLPASAPSLRPCGADRRILRSARADSLDQGPDHACDQFGCVFRSGQAVPGHKR